MVVSEADKKEEVMPSKVFDINVSASLLLREFGMGRYDVIRAINFYGANTVFAAGKIARDYPATKDVRSDLPYLFEAVHLLGEDDIRELVDGGFDVPRLLTEYRMHDFNGHRLLLPPKLKPKNREITEMSLEDIISSFGLRGLSELGISPVYLGQSVIIFELMPLTGQSNRTYADDVTLDNDSRADRRKQRFGGTHGWRRNYRPARLALDGREENKDATAKTPRLRFLVYAKEPIIREKNINRLSRPVGTNEILEYLGFEAESDKKTYLMSFNGNTHYGADIVRTAYHLAQFFGVSANGHRPILEVRGVIKDIADIVHKYGTQHADTLLTAVGVDNDNIRIFKDLAPLNIGGKVGLVPPSELDMIVIRLGELPLKSPIGPHLMESLGYSSSQVRGFIVYQ